MFVYTEYSVHNEAKNNPSPKLGACIIAAKCSNTYANPCVHVTVLRMAQLHTGQFYRLSLFLMHALL